MKLNLFKGPIKPPCSKCPYQLGYVHYVRSPCPDCERNGFRIYKRLLKQMEEDEKNQWYS